MIITCDSIISIEPYTANVLEVIIENIDIEGSDENIEEIIKIFDYDRLLDVIGKETVMDYFELYEE